VGKPEGTRPLGRSKRRWDDAEYNVKFFVPNIKMDLLVVGCGGMDGIDVAQDRARWRALVNAVMNIQVP
jgi:hypothetical protein